MNNPHSPQHRAHLFRGAAPVANNPRPPNRWVAARQNRPEDRCNVLACCPLQFFCFPSCRLVGRYPTGSGARTVVASLPLAPPSGRRRGPPRRPREPPPTLPTTRLAHPTGTLAFGEAPSLGPTRRREAPSACSHWEAAPLPCARHFLWGTFLRGVGSIK